MEANKMEAEHRGLKSKKKNKNTKMRELLIISTMFMILLFVPALANERNMLRANKMKKKIQTQRPKHILPDR